MYLKFPEEKPGSVITYNPITTFKPSGVRNTKHLLEVILMVLLTKHRKNRNFPTFDANINPYPADVEYRVSS
jgi:hypothetical protein